MRARATRSVIGALLLVLAGAFVAPASAAAPSKVSSEPEEGEELHEAPERVTITFDQPLDPESHIEVTNHCGDRVDEQPTEVTGTEMSVPVTGDRAGTYHVTYVAKGVGGITGEQTGRFTFSVHAGDDCDGGGEGGHEGDHQGSGDHGSGAGNHGMHGEGAHAPGAHESTAHRSATDASTHDIHGSGTGHDAMDHGGHSEGGKHAGHHASGVGSERDATRHITSAPSNDLRGPSSDAVMWSLGLCALLGLLGGAVLRFSAPS